MASFWEPLPVDKKAWRPVDAIRNFYIIRLTINIILIALAAWGGVRLISQAQTIPEVYVTSESGRVSQGIPAIFQMTSENVAPFFSDVMSALFTRTEAGRVINNIEAYVDTAVLASIDRGYTGIDRSVMAAGYTQRLTVLGMKFRTVSQGVTQTSFKTLLTMHTDSAYSSSIVYFDVRWQKVFGTTANPLGWKLAGIVISTEALYNQEQILEEIRAQTAIVKDLPLPHAAPDQVKKPDPNSENKGPENQTSVGAEQLGDEK